MNNNPETIHSLIRPETSSVEFARPSGRRPAATKAAAASIVCAAMAITSVWLLPGVFSHTPMLQVFLYITGVLCSLAAVVCGLAAIVGLRKSALPRGNTAAWCGLGLGVVMTAIAAFSGEALIAGYFADRVECAGTDYAFDRPEGWIVLPSNVFDLTADAEIMAADGGVYAVMSRGISDTLIEGLADYLADVHQAPGGRHHHHHHHGAARRGARYYFFPFSVRLSDSDIENLRRIFTQEKEQLNRQVQSIEARVKSLREEGRDRKAAQLDKPLEGDRKKFGGMRKVIENNSVNLMLHYLIQKRMKVLYNGRITIEREGGLRPYGARPTAEVVLRGVSEDGEKLTCFAILRQDGGICYRITGFGRAQDLPRLKRELRSIDISFRHRG